MPLPIKPITDNPHDPMGNVNNIDYSFLSQHLDNQNSKTAGSLQPKASNKDAELLMKLWTEGNKVDENTIKVTEELGVSSKEILRLKTYGLLTGTAQEVSFTPRAKAIITTMVMGESNQFLRNQKTKSYTEILANVSKRGKKGYRIPRFASDNSNCLRF